MGERRAQAVIVPLTHRRWLPQENEVVEIIRTPRSTGEVQSAYASFSASLGLMRSARLAGTTQARNPTLSITADVIGSSSEGRPLREHHRGAGGARDDRRDAAEVPLHADPAAGCRRETDAAALSAIRELEKTSAVVKARWNGLR